MITVPAGELARILRTELGALAGYRYALAIARADGRDAARYAQAAELLRPEAWLAARAN